MIASIVREPRYVYHAYYHDREGVIGELCVDLVEKYGYKERLIETDASVPIETPHGSMFVSIDILVRTPEGSPLLIIEVAAEDTYELGYETAIHKLFALARNITRNPASPLFLIYHTHWHANGKLKGRHTIIDYRLFPDFEIWKNASFPGRPEIPNNR